MILRFLRALQELGLSAICQFGIYNLALRSGYYRWRLPKQTWMQVKLHRLLCDEVPKDPAQYGAYREEQQTYSMFNLRGDRYPALQKRRRAIESDANAIIQGRFRLFGIPEIELGYPPDWHAFAPLAGVGDDISLREHRHWSRYDLNALPHDVKLLWEPSRFGWVYPLAQAYALSGEARYFETFWTLYSSWLDANAPQVGLHWYSAQEVAIRLIALLFAAHTYSDAIREVPGRWSDLLKGIGIHAERIPPSLSYARAQNNNHLLLESAALYLTGITFPEMRQASGWKRQGRRSFEEGIAKQVFPDGGYIQHSTNYQRLALQIGILVTGIANEAGEPLRESTQRALGNMAECLASLVDEKHGGVPNFGPNDGAMLLPLSTCQFADFRPTIQAASQLFLGEGHYPAGEWDDLSQWLGLGDETESSFASELKQVLSVDLPHAGMSITRKNGLKAVLRAVEFQNRPGHSDQLHIDIWYEGINIARDPGSYLYNASPPWENPLSGSLLHNTVTLDHREPMLRAGRFLWLNRSQANVHRYKGSLNDRIEVIFARHITKQWPELQHQRTVAVIGSDLIIIADDILGKGEHQLLLNWNLADLAWQVEAETVSMQHEHLRSSLSWSGGEGVWGLYRAGEHVGGEVITEDPRIYGWHAPTYAQKEPGLQLVVRTQQNLPARMISAWTFQDADIDELIVDWMPPEKNRVAFDRLRWGKEEWKV
jgi:hypothetical protein